MASVTGLALPFGTLSKLRVLTFSVMGDIPPALGFLSEPGIALNGAPKDCWRGGVEAAIDVARPSCGVTVPDVPTLLSPSRPSRALNF